MSFFRNIFLGYNLSFFKSVVCENGIVMTVLLYFVVSLFILVLSPFLFLMFPFVWLNEKSKNWFKGEENGK